MRRILFAIIAVTLLVSCGNSNAEQSNVYVAQETRMDAIIEDSLALIAWGDVRFGMSKQEVMNSKAFGGKKEYSYLVAIANYSFPKKKYQPTQKVERMKSEDSIRKTIRENSF